MYKNQIELFETAYIVSFDIKQIWASLKENRSSLVLQGGKCPLTFCIGVCHVLKEKTRHDKQTKNYSEKGHLPS